MKPLRKSFLSRVAVAAVVAAGCVVLVLAAQEVDGGIINPSFETGDLTGWTGLASWTVLGDGWASHGQYYVTMVSPSTDPWTFPGDDSWLTNMHQSFTMPLWAETMSVDVRDDGLDVSVAVTPLTAGPPAVVLTDNPAGPLVLNGFTRYTGDVSSLAGLDVRVGISVGLDHVPGTPHRAAVDNFRIVPEPGTLAMVWAAASLWGLRKGRPGDGTHVFRLHEGGRGEFRGRAT